MRKELKIKEKKWKEERKAFINKIEILEKNWKRMGKE